MRRFVVFASMILICSTCALASDLSSLPPEAQASIKAALQRDLAIQNFTLTASDGIIGADFGTSVAIDGDTVVVGALRVLNDSPGTVYVFVKPKTGWSNMTQTAELVASDGQPKDYFGSSVAISGNTIVVGASGATVNGNPYQGAAYVFVEPAGGWSNMTETAKLTASDGVPYAELGVSASISGNTAILGAPRNLGNNPGPGIAYIFVEPNGGWRNTTQTAELTPSDSSSPDNFAVALSISANTAVIGGGLSGAYVFVESPNGWENMTETGKLTQSDPQSEDGFGASVSINGDIAVVGAQGHGSDESGAVYVYVKPANGWASMTQTAELSVFQSSQSCLGSSVAINASIVLGGAVCTHGFTGAAYVFLKPPGGWQNSSKFAARLSVPFSYQNDLFGTSVAVSGMTGVIGAPNAPTSPPCKGGKCASGAGESFIFTTQ
jgi:hypothetical protein